ncbi:MAG: hypothetical protein KDD62_07660, partial [Bdellovibrionales bacterium]|nr:hypothetical protein [Bdellovibrionales bacterium]
MNLAHELSGLGLAKVITRHTINRAILIMELPKKNTLCQTPYQAAKGLQRRFPPWYALESSSTIQ